MADEQLKVTEAWEYFRNKTGIEIERRAFFSWIEEGRIVVNGRSHEVSSNQIGKIHFVSRAQLERVIAMLIKPTT